ncbi:MAG: class I SAM-dependent methyltransferase [Reyranellaceae bacterium]
MSFSADWLTQREPFDRQARNPKVLRRVIAALSGRRSITIVDLACGTGAMLRALGPHLPMHQSWRLFDNDLSLLARVPPAANVQAQPLDLVSDLEGALDGPVDLVTTSALLDLVSDIWLKRLITEVAAHRLPFYACLSYDGRIDFAPGDASDAAIIAAVNAHQRTDKGFGPALGPMAARTAVEYLETVGYVVEAGAADWVLREADLAMQEATLSGWAAAAAETGELSTGAVAEWLATRRTMLRTKRSTIRIGHVDLFAMPTDARRLERSQSNSTSSPSR